MQPVYHSAVREPDLAQPFDCSLAVRGQPQLHLIYMLSKSCYQIMRCRLKNILEIIVGFCALAGIELDIWCHLCFLLEKQTL